VESQQELLQSVSNSLSELRFINDEIQDESNNVENPVNLQLPIMKKLKVLDCILQYESTAPGLTPFYTIIPIQPEQVPILHTLSIDHTILGSVLAGSTFATVRELFLQSNRPNCDVLPALGLRFPNLRKLEGLCTELNERDLDLLLPVLENIEELTLTIMHHSAAKNFNLFISGVSMECEWFLRQMENCVGTESILSWIQSPRVSIRDLERKYWFFLSLVVAIIY